MYASSAIAGMVGAMVWHPFDYVRVNLLVNKRYILRNCYKGFAFDMTITVMRSCIIFPTQEFFKKQLTWLNPTQQDTISGMIAGLSVAFLASPMNVIDTPLLSEPKSTVVSIVKNEYKKNGIKGFYKGVIPTVAGSVVGFGTYFTMFNLFNKKINNIVSSSFLASIIAISVAYPFDSMRTLMQQKDSKKTAMECFKESIRIQSSHNMKSFTVFIIRMVLSVPLTHCTYIMANDFLNNYKKVEISSH